jgi:hypothetical protein
VFFVISNPQIFKSFKSKILNNMHLTPSDYKLPSRTELRELAPNHIGIVKVIKSRIIQKDAAKIVEMAKRIKVVNPALKVSLLCTKNICSKSLALLEKEGIGVELVEG